MGNEVEADIITAEPIAGKDRPFMENFKATGLIYSKIENIVFSAGILFEFRKDYHKNDGAKRSINLHSSFFLSRLIRVREEK